MTDYEKLFGVNFDQSSAKLQSLEKISKKVSEK